ncbi:MlaD family protein [Ruegeria sp. 2012CJ41-6]|uniref:MlaD family protein n=1 Tax=Ruegeria spongiae TaxID=2942209 RepID=A0ABT0Q1I1_9RHOB|nr:MlaD family protein [Ruegeria spongiae]MCL6283736.1 MlaD family protein [Ruegeria spongiae]
MSDANPSKLEVKSPRKGLIGGFSAVWLVPAVALLGSLGLALQSYLESDVPITIEFPEATGMEAGKTQLKFRDVVVGSVGAIEFSEDLSHVDVTVNVRRDMARYLDDDARFWLVHAEITSEGVSGLDTLLSGAYINAEWDPEPGKRKDHFIAEKKAPIIAPNAKGIEIKLTSTETGSVSVGAPLLYKGFKVGKVEDLSLSEDGSTITITTFVEEPYDKLINTGSRFWNASGIEVDLTDEGLKVGVESLSALLQGGIAFDTTISGGEPVTETTRFDLYPNLSAAKDSRFNDDLRATVTVASAFEGSVKGLREGANVDYRGLKVGEVKELSVYAPDDAQTPDDVLLLVSYTIQPNRLGITDVNNPEEVLEYLAQVIPNTGLRARLMPNSLLSGGLHVELFEDPALPEAQLERTGHPLPLVPTVATPPDTLNIAAEGVLNRVAQLPIEELMDRTIKLISDVDAIVADNQTKQIPANINSLLGNVDTIAGSEATQQLPEKLNEAISSVNAMLTEFEQKKGVDALVVSLENLKTITANVSTASADVPKLIADIDAVVAKVNALPIEDTVASTNSLLASADRFISNDSMQDVPPALTGALNEVRETLQELRAGGAAENLNRALASAGNAADEIAKAAASLPELAKRLNDLADTAEATIAAYGPNSPVNREVRAAVADIRQAVHSINALAQTIRRKPNSLLVGR